MRSLVLATLTLLVVACSSASDPIAGEPGTATPSDTSSNVPLDNAPIAPDAGVDAPAASDAAPVGCGELAGVTRFTCSKDGTTRGKCAAGAAVIETCARGCLREAAPTDDVCLGTSSAFSCSGSYATTKSTSGDHYLTAFGCWVDSAGTSHADSGDNCIPSCLAKAKAAGLCTPADTGPACERRVNWYTADGARFGCLARLKVTNPANGKSVIAVALDYGPSCSVENSVGRAVLDASGRVDDYLFGAPQGASDRSAVHVVEVDPSTPLGPTP
jgi:hypothetical protein